MTPPSPPPTTREGSASDPAAALRDVATLGGFFAISTGPAEGVDPSWRPLPDLSGAVLDARIDQVAEQLGGVPRRIAGSLLGLSVSARLTGLLLGTAGLHGMVPRLHDTLRWRPWSGGPAPLWLEDPEALNHPGDERAVVVGTELERTARPVLDAIGEQASVSEQVLWGNVASSLGGALRMLLTERPASSGPVLALARELTTIPPLAGLGEVVDEPAHPTGVGFARRTCCLFYRVPGGGTCGDCVLHR